MRLDVKPALASNNGLMSLIWKAVRSFSQYRADLGCSDTDLNMFEFDLVWKQFFCPFALVIIMEENVHDCYYAMQ